MPPKAVSKTIDVLSPLWRRVLGRSQADMDENFFELGGNPWLAIELFRGIEENTGRNLPPMMIYQAPTLAALACLLDDPAPPRLAPLALLKAGSVEPPAFLLHGMGSNVMEFFELVTLVETRHSMYGMQARGSDGLEAPCEGVEDWARFHLETIRHVQPQGPYVLIGYSFGGLVAFEMAQQLAERSAEVALLVLIDSYPHRRFVPWVQRAKVLAREFRERGTRGATAVLGRSQRSPDIARGQGSHSANRMPLGTSFTPAMSLVQEYTARALRNYRPRPYAGRIRFVRAGVSLHFPDNAIKAWAKFAGSIEVETVPGDHHGMLNDHTEVLAAVLSRYLAEVPDAGPVKP